MIKTKPSHMQGVLKKFILFLCHETLCLKTCSNIRTNTLVHCCVCALPRKALSSRSWPSGKQGLIFFAEHLAKGRVGLLLARSTLQVTLRKQVVITIHFGKLQLKNNQPSLPSGSLFGVRSQADLECPCFVYLYSQTLSILQLSETFTPAEMKSVFTGVGWTRLLRRYTEPSKGKCKKGQQIT